MKAIVIREAGGPDVLEWSDVPDPVPQRGEVRVRVRATSVNRADIMQREGKYPPPPGCPANILGLEYAGDIDAIGDDVRDLKIGDRVFGILSGGTYAQYVVTHSRTVTKIPNAMTYEVAAAIPEVFITAYDALVSQGNLRSGDYALVSAAASGVGTAACQIISAIGARSIGTTRSEAKRAGLIEMGFDHVIVSQNPDFAKEVISITGGAGVNVVLELVSGPYLNEDILCLALRGRLIVVGLLAGSKCELNYGQVLSRRLMIQGTTLRARPLEEKIEIAKVFANNILPLFENGKLEAVTDKIFDLTDAAEAHRYVEKNETFGKVVMRVP